MIVPPNEFENMLDPILLEGTVDSSGFVENSLIINNWAHLGSIKLQLSECNPSTQFQKAAIGSRIHYKFYVVSKLKKLLLGDLK